MGGTPLKDTAEENQRWATNPQYLIELERDADVFIFLGQRDQRLVPGAVYPFPALKKTMISVWQLEDDECHLSAFDRKRRPKPMMTTIKEYREQSLRLRLQKGRYMVVPSMKNHSIGKHVPFFLSIYFSCGEEEDRGGDIFKYFSARYVNPYTGEEEH